MIHVYLADEDDVLQEVTEFVNLTTPGAVSVTTNAEEASVATSEIDFDDQDGVLDVVGLRRFVIEDDAATYARVFSGYVWDRHITRGTYRAGPLARSWKTEVQDINQLLSDRIIEQSDGNRPAETDVERMQWVCGTVLMTDFFSDMTTYFDTSDPVAMDPSDYRGQFVNNLINDCLQASLKNSYALDVTPSAGVYNNALWYGSHDLTTFTSPIKISNLEADEDEGVVFAPFLDADMGRSPTRVYSGLRVNYDGGFDYQTSPSTVDEFNTIRDTIYDQPNIKTQAKAHERGYRQLATMSKEDDAITCTILVPSSQVNDARAGMRIQAKFSHFPDYDSYTWFRILDRTVTLIRNESDDLEGLWENRMTLTPQEAPPPPIPLVTTDHGCGYVVPTCAGDPGLALPVGPLTGMEGGAFPGQTSDSLRLYHGATYHAYATATHATTNFECNLDSNFDGPIFPLNFGNLPPMASPTPPVTVNESDFVGVSPGGPGTSYCAAWTLYSGAGYAGCNNVGATGTITITYVSGPDPRFEDLPPVSCT